MADGRCFPSPEIPKATTIGTLFPAPLLRRVADAAPCKCRRNHGPGVGGAAAQAPRMEGRKLGVPGFENGRRSNQETAAPCRHHQIPGADVCETASCDCLNKVEHDADRPSLIKASSAIKAPVSSAPQLLKSHCIGRGSRKARARLVEPSGSPDLERPRKQCSSSD